MKRHKVILIVSIIAIVSYAAFLGLQAYLERQAETDSRKQQVLHLTRLRANNKRLLNDLLVAFPEATGPSAICYQTALSNYIEDQWDRIAKETGCNQATTYCGPVAPEHKGFPRPWWASETWAKKCNIELNNPIFISQTLGKFLNPIEQSVDPADKANAFRVWRHSYNLKMAEKSSPAQNNERLEQLNHYINSCASNRPAVWAMVGTIFPVSEADLNDSAFKLMHYRTLLEHVFASSIPEEQRGYIGCLETLVDAKGKIWKQGEAERDVCSDTHCMETIPTDTKEALTHQLDELKIHQCDAVFANQLAHP